MSISNSHLSSNAEGPDKVDMSLDDIIRLNRQQNQRAPLWKQNSSARGSFIQGKRMGMPIHRGGVNKMFRRRGQGVITGLAAKKAALLKGVSPLNRPALNRTNLNKRMNRPFIRNPAVSQRARPFFQRRQTLPQAQRQRYAQNDPQRFHDSNFTRPFRLHRNLPTLNQAQRDARQATFLSRRGLKIRTQVQKKMVSPVAPGPQRTQQWHAPQNNSGILTVSIENPTARTQPEPAHAWSLHPPTVTPPTVTSVPETEKKTPKGVSLQFDINSVGKQQTAMTLNERFRILKQQRVAAQEQNARGGRFVTVG